MFIKALNASASEISLHPIPIGKIINPCSRYSLINSVDFHPQRNLFCITLTHANCVILYQIDKGESHIFQTLSNPASCLSLPQHAAFSPDGTKIVVANWENQTLALYKCEESGLFQEKPAALISSPRCLVHCKPHGIAFSPSGHFLAIAYGAANDHGRAIALFRVRENNLELASVIESIWGIPKGIAFSPDGACLLVSFADTSSLAIFNLEGPEIFPIPRQILHGSETKISRPEDVKISPDGKYCAVSNSDQDTVTFYPFDPTSNQITQPFPCYVHQNPEAEHSFPHGMAFSPDGFYFLVTEFGPIRATPDGNLFWKKETRPQLAKVNLYARF
ncbi:MAG: YncE family protein [Verrucomicrobia bacterium]|nr:YncE family protein [Verrucomicrobiota bacterium]